MTKLTPRETAFPEMMELRRGFDDMFNRLLFGRPVFSEIFPCGEGFRIPAAC